LVEVEIGEFVVSPFDKLRCLPTRDFTTLDTLLRSYCEPWGIQKPAIEKATALRFKNLDFAVSYSEEQRALLGDLSLVLAMDGLSQRSYFSDHKHPYSNSDHFAMVIQGFTKLPDGAFVVPRSRGAKHGTFFSVGVFEQARAPHTPSLNHSVDATFCGALLK